MPNQYYKKDIHKSMEALLNGLYVYQYLLDTSTFGLILRILVQDVSSVFEISSPGMRLFSVRLWETLFLVFTSWIGLWS
jgi:hypothetical protein